MLNISSNHNNRINFPTYNNSNIAPNRATNIENTAEPTVFNNGGNDQNYFVFNCKTQEASFQSVKNEIESNLTNANPVSGAGLILKISVPSLGGEAKDYVITTKRKITIGNSDNSLSTAPNEVFHNDCVLGGPIPNDKGNSFSATLKGIATGKTSFLFKTNNDLHDRVSNLIERAIMEQSVCSHSSSWYDEEEGDTKRYNYLTAIASVEVTPHEFQELTKLCNDTGLAIPLELKPLVQTSRETYSMPEKIKHTRVQGAPIAFNDISLNAFSSAAGNSIQKLIQ